MRQERRLPDSISPRLLHPEVTGPCFPKGTGPNSEGREGEEETPPGKYQHSERNGLLHTGCQTGPSPGQRQPGRCPEGNAAFLCISLLSVCTVLSGWVGCRQGCCPPESQNDGPRPLARGCSDWPFQLEGVITSRALGWDKMLVCMPGFSLGASWQTGF